MEASAGPLIIDSQVHAYESDSRARSWLDHPDWPPRATGADTVAAMDALGVDGAILVSPFLLYGYDASYSIEVQRSWPNRFALVKMVDCADPAVADEIAAWKLTPGSVGVRIRLAAPAVAGGDGLRSAMRAAERHDLAVNVFCGGDVSAATRLVDRYPTTRFVIDHLGLDQHLADVSRAWDDLDRVLDLSRRPNVALKLTGVCTLSHEPDPYPDIWDPLERIFDAWGVDRCLWGSDWTRTSRTVSYEQALRAFLVSDRLSDAERAMVMGGACAKAYGWSPGETTRD